MAMGYNPQVNKGSSLGVSTQRQPCDRTFCLLEERRVQVVECPSIWPSPTPMSSLATAFERYHSCVVGYRRVVTHTQRFWAMAFLTSSRLVCSGQQVVVGGLSPSLGDYQSP